MAQADSYDTTNPSGLALQQAERVETLNKLLRLRAKRDQRSTGSTRPTTTFRESWRLTTTASHMRAANPPWARRMVDRSKSWGVVMRTSPAATSKTTTLTVKKMIRRRTTCALDQTLSGGLAASAGALLPAGEQVACHARTEARWLLGGLGG